MSTSQSGFTLIEIIVVLGVLATLLAFASINVLRLQRHTHLQTTVTTFVSDLYEQRQHSMTGDTQGRQTLDSYGVYVETSRYVLFHGATYSAGLADNVSIPIEAPIQMSATTFPNATVLFSKGSGEIQGFTAGANSITLRNASNGEQIVITLNQYGSITSDLP